MMTTITMRNVLLQTLALLWLLLGVAGTSQAQTVVYYHTDALGSPVAVTDAGGYVIARNEHEPYGKQLTPVLQDGPGYTGHVGDAATGLSYMQQRYYDPEIGRFLSVDPVTVDFNRYWYANNNPYKFTDPDGRQSAADRMSDAYTKAQKEGRTNEFRPFVVPAVIATAVMAAPVIAVAGGEAGMAVLANPGTLSAATDVAAGMAGVTGTAGALQSTGGVIRQFEQTTAQNYFRVFSGDSTVGRWLTSVAPKSSAWAQEALALPPGNKATMIQKVLVPAGTRMERSRASPVPEWGRRGGAEQFKLLNEVPPENFGPGTPLP